MSFFTNVVETPLTEQQITEEHKQRKYVPRYFVAKGNQVDTQVYEVNLRDYEFHRRDHYMIIGRLNWLIRGPLEDREIWVYTGSPIYDMGGKEPISIPGILTQNETAVRFLSRKIPAVKNYLTDYKQFYVGD